jgi:hypothetical protein
VLIVAGLCTGCDRAKGLATVEKLCARDGGEQIFDTMYVSGYLREGEDYFCHACIEHLGRRDFERVYASVKRSDDGESKA